MAVSDKICRHVASLSEQLPVYCDDSGCFAGLNSTQLELPDRVSVRRVVIFAGRIGSTYANQAAEQIGYCLGGRARIGVRSSQGSSDTFTVGEGEALFLPSTSTHTIENIGDHPAEFVFALAEEIALTQMTFSPGQKVLDVAKFSDALSVGKPPKNGPEVSRFCLKRVLTPENDFHEPPRELGPEWPFLSRFVISRISIRALGTSHCRQAGKRQAGYVLRGAGDLRIISNNGEVSHSSLQQGDVFSIYTDTTYALENIGAFPLEVISFQPRPKAQTKLATSPAEIFLRPGELEN